MPSETQLQLIDLLCVNCENEQTDEETTLKRFGTILFDQIKLLETSLDILDNENSITKNYNESSHRVVWKVRGSQGNEYTCLNGFCSCPSFLQQIKQPQELNVALLCKHMLAVKVAICLNKYQTINVTNDKFIELLCSSSTVPSNLYGNPMSHYGSGSKWHR